MRTPVLVMAVLLLFPLSASSAPAKSPVVMFCFVSENGHRFNVTANNPSNRSYRCTIDCPYTLNGVKGNQRCEGNVPANAKGASFCTTDNSSGVFKIAGNGTYKC